MSFASIILAAGKGARIGKCKAALPFGASGETLLSHIISTYINAGVNNILVVTGNWKEETVTAARNFSSVVRFINNNNPGIGMFSSVHKGVSSIDNCIKNFFVHPVDIPLVKEETLLRMKDTVLNSKSNKIYAVPICKNEEGHPVLISSLLIPELLNWNGECGLRGFLSSQKSNKETVNVDDEGTLFDIDDNEYYAEILRRIILMERQQPKTGGR